MTRCGDCPDLDGKRMAELYPGWQPRAVCCLNEPLEPERRQAVALDGLQGNRAQRRAQAARERKRPRP